MEGKVMVQKRTIATQFTKDLLRSHACIFCFSIPVGYVLQTFPLRTMIVYRVPHQNESDNGHGSAKINSPRHGTFISLACCFSLKFLHFFLDL